MRASFDLAASTRLAALFVVLAGVPVAHAQVQVVEEEQVASTQVVERGYVRGQGRGVQYGAHLVSPIYATTLGPQEAGARAVDVSAGLGVLARIGWEFPSGVTLELMGGLAANGVNRPAGFDEMSTAVLRAEVGAGLRYMFINDTAFVPFVGISGGLRWFWYDYVDFANTLATVDGELTGMLQGVLGFQIEMSPFFGIEAGCAIEWIGPGNALADPGVLAVMPFVGVTLYVYDETGN